jgi:hypothetical protein
VLTKANKKTHNIIIIIHNVTVRIHNITIRTNNLQNKTETHRTYNHIYNKTVTLMYMVLLSPRTSL